MRIDVRLVVVIEGDGDELVSFAEAILLAAYGGPECVGAFLGEDGVTPVRVVRTGARADVSAWPARPARA